MKNPEWVQSGKRCQLMSNDELLVDLLVKPGGASLFSIGNKNYVIKQGGVWQPVFTVFAEDKQLLKLIQSFWGSHGKIVFNDGTTYLANYSTKKGISLRIVDGEHEILCYSLTRRMPAAVANLTFGTAMIDAEKLLVLAALAKTIITTIYSDGGGDDAIATSILLTSV